MARNCWSLAKKRKPDLLGDNGLFWGVGTKNAWLHVGRLPGLTPVLYVSTCIWMCVYQQLTKERAADHCKFDRNLIFTLKFLHLYINYFLLNIWITIDIWCTGTLWSSNPTIKTFKWSNDMLSLVWYTFFYSKNNLKVNPRNRDQILPS